MPRPQRPIRRMPAAQREALPPEEPRASVDPADVILGVVLFMAIPTVIYILLGSMGMPVNGEKGPSWTDSLVEKEAIKNRKPPPMTREEFRMRLAHVDRLLETNATEFQKRFSKVRLEDPRECHLWWKRARGVLKYSEDVLRELENQLKDSKELASVTGNQQDIRVRQGMITQKIADLEKDRPFLDH